MPHYEYQAQNSSGELVKGTIEASTVSRAVSQLESQGLAIVAIGQVMPARENTTPLSPERASPQADSDELQVMLSQAMQEGAEFLPALRALAAEKTATVSGRRLRTFIDILEQGNVYAAARSFAPLAEYWVPLIRASRSREPADAFVRFFQESRDAHPVALQGRLAASYGVIVVSAAAIVMTFLCLFIVPTFANVFAGFGLRVPRLTQFVITLSEWVVTGRILLIVAAATGLVLVLGLALRLLPQPLKLALGDRFGTLFGRSAAMTRFTAYAADLLEAEAQPGLALRLAALAARSPRLERAAARWQSLERGTVFPAPVHYAFENPLAPAVRGALLRELSRSYSERAMARTSWTRGMVEPLAILFIGCNVGIVVLALFLPLISLIHGLS